MRKGLFALVWLNLCVRWREWRAGEPDGVFLLQMRALWAADVIRPHRFRHLRLAGSDSQAQRVALRSGLLQTPGGSQSFERHRNRLRRA